MDTTSHSPDLKGEIVFYKPDSNLQLEVKIFEDTVRLNRHQLATLFGRDVKTVGKHINNALQEELAGISSVANFATVQNEWERKVVRQVEYYNLDMILSIWYRVKSPNGITFRKRANTVLKDYMIQGIAIHKRIEHLEQHAITTDKRLFKAEEQLDFFIEKALPQQSGIFFDGEVFDAYSFV